MKTAISALLSFTIAFVLGSLFAFGLSISPADTTPEFEKPTAEPSPVSPSAKKAIESNDVPDISSELHNQNLEETRNEFFTDDKRIGRRKNNKIELRCYSRGAGRFAEIRFYSRTEYGAWVERQSFQFEKDGVVDCNPIVEDFNNDGLDDFTYESNVAARGANEVRKLFIYDKRQDELVYIKNSDDYANLAYNKKLDCVGAFLVYGATSTVFLRIDGDNLREFASVETGLERIVTVTNKLGERRVLRREKMDPDNFEELYRRFSTYDPPR